MRSYWLKVLAGAFLVFLVGTAFVTIARRVKTTVVSTIESSDPLSLPLIGMVPFSVDRVHLGSLRRLEFLRSTPSDISGVRVVVKLDTDSAGENLAGCRLALQDLDRLGNKTSFECVGGDTGVAGLEPFGFVVLREGADSLQLLLPPDAVAELKKVRIRVDGHGIRVSDAGDSVSAAAINDSVQSNVARELRRAAAEIERAQAEAQRARSAAVKSPPAAPAAPQPPAVPPKP